MIKFVNIFDNKKDVFVKTKEGMQVFENYPWHFFVDLKDAKSNKVFFQDLLDSGYVKDMKVEGEYVALYCPFLERDNVIRQLKTQGVKTYEDDLRPWQLFLVDEDVELETDQSILFFDIETDDRGVGIEPGRDPILSISAIGSDEREFYFSYRPEDKNGELKMLRKFVKQMEEYDVVAGWHSEGFDLVAIATRINGREGIYSGYNSILPRGKKLMFSCMVIEQGAKDLGGLDSVRRLGKLKAKPLQFNHIDLMQKYKEMHYRDTELIKKVRSFSLSSVAMVTLNEDKVDLHGESIYKLWKERPDELKRYNMQDVRLLVKLDKALNISFQKLVEHQVCCARLNDYTSHGKIDVFALRGAKRLGKHLPSKPEKDPFADAKRRDDDRGKEDSDYEGGFVFEPVKGFHTNVYALDYSSLYPSIIKTFNVSIDSFKGMTTWKEGMEFPKDTIVMPTGAMFSRDEIGIIPSIIQYVLDSRNQIRHVDMLKMKKDSLEYQNAHYRQYAFKVLANSMYGIMGASFSRYYKKELAEGITLTGQYLIKMSAKWFEERGFQIIYGDSDSLYLKKDGEVDADKYADELKIFIEESLRRDFNIKTCHLYMSSEGKFDRFLAIEKKKYAGIHPDGDIKIIGLEVKKRDALPRASAWQQELLDSFLIHGETDPRFYISWVRACVNAVKSLSPEEITFQKRLSKEIEDYGKENKNGRALPIPVHVKVAMWVKDNLDKMGPRDDKSNLYSQGSYISWIITGSKNGLTAVHPLAFDGHFDVPYYIDACLAPSIRILESVYPTVDWAEVITGKDKQRLF